MVIRVFEEKSSLAKAAAAEAAKAIRSAIDSRGFARIIAATGASQFEFLEALTATGGIDWTRVELFHLDEYVDLPANHPASFCKYIQKRLIDKTGIRNYHLLNGHLLNGQLLNGPLQNGKTGAAEIIRSASEAIALSPIDIAFVGIGENGHLAFNDPPADFQTEEPYILVELDDACRQQQVGEGWFETLAEVPRLAISMSIRQILKSQEIICIAPDARKAKAIQKSFAGEISPLAPASILQRHPRATIYLDHSSAQLLSPATLASFATTR
jgi:glucosamine-6-phosphate deaminase